MCMSITDNGRTANGGNNAFVLSFLQINNGRRKVTTPKSLGGKRERCEVVCPLVAAFRRADCLDLALATVLLYHLSSLLQMFSATLGDLTISII